MRVRCRAAAIITVCGSLLAPTTAWAQGGPTPTDTSSTVPAASATTTAPPPTATPLPPAAATNGGSPPVDTTTTTVPPDSTPPTIGLHVTHPHFSPNGDRVRDKTFVQLTAVEPVDVVLVFRNASGTARKTEHYSFGPGDLVASWGGRIERNGVWGRARDGDYIMKVTATDEAGNATRKTRSVTVDTTTPTFGWTSITPDPWGATGAASFNFVSHDASPPLTVQGSAWNRTGLLDVSTAVSRPQGAVALAWRPNYSDGSVFLPGNYFAAVQVTDDAGNTLPSSPFRGFRVERPVVSTVVRRVDGAGNRVAVTFDDCNDGAAWTSILSTLDRYGVSGTFFCPGDQVRAHPGEAQATASAGMSIGSHSNGHAQLTHLSYADIVTRLRTDQAAWWSIARVTPSPYFRPPYGSYDSTVLAAAGNTGFRYTVIWDVDPNDWTDPGSAAIASRVLGAVRPGSIVLLHVKGQTAVALPAILSGLRARGLQQSSLAELFHAAGWH